MGTSQQSLPPRSKPWRTHPKSTARGSGPQRSELQLVASGPTHLYCREDGKLRCPAGSSLWLSEVRQENAFTEALLLTWVSEETVSLVLSKSSVWGEALKVTVPAE